MNNIEQEGYQLYIPSVNDELLLVKSLRIEICTYRTKAFDQLIELLGLEQQAFVDIYGKFVGRSDPLRRQILDMSVEIPAGAKLRVKSIHVMQSRQGGVQFILSGMTEELRAKLQVKKRRNCKNYAEFYLPIEKVSSIRYLPVTEPDISEEC